MDDTKSRGVTSIKRGLTIALDDADDEDDDDDDDEDEDEEPFVGCESGGRSAKRR